MRNELAIFARKVYRLDFLNLLLCMAVGHVVINNPFFGAAVYLFSDIIKAWFLANLEKFRHSDGEHYLSRIMLALVVIGGVAVGFIYPLINTILRANYVSLFAIALVVRDYFGAVPVTSIRKWQRPRYYITTVIIHLCFDALAGIILWWNTEGTNFIILMGITLFTGLKSLLNPEMRIPSHSLQIRNSYEKLGSYRTFSSMNLFATMAVNLGVMVYFFHILMPILGGFSIVGYAWLLIWLFVIQTVLLVTAVFLRRSNRGLALGEFVAGALTWILGTIFMYKAESMIGRLLWTSAWGVGFALISAAIRKFHADFEAVGTLAGEEYDRQQLAISNTIEGAMASIISSVIMLLIMAVWTFIGASGHHEAVVIKAYDIVIMQLPAICMLVALILALRQPLVGRNREKLMNFIASGTKNEGTRESLMRMFVRKYRMRFGVRVLLTFVRPFFHLKVTGKEHLRPGDYPSVFVSNHNFIYGPIAAVIYLPTYFRPWIHNVMLQQETAEREIGRNFAVVKKIFGKRLGGWIIHQGTRIVCWALSSFDPIPVVRGASRDVMSTFNASLEVLQEGDNILIFPERPKENRNDGVGQDVLRTFYTGFAHIAKMYHDRTGRALLFYPLYSDLDNHTFSIGEPVLYDAAIDPHESKRRLAEELQHRIAELSDRDQQYRQ